MKSRIGKAIYCTAACLAALGALAPQTVLAADAADGATMRKMVNNSPKLMSDIKLYKTLNALDDQMLADVMEAMGLKSISGFDKAGRTLFIETANAFTRSAGSKVPEGPGPANDNCAGATPVGDGSFAFDTTLATTDGPDQPGVPPGGCSAFGVTNVNLDVWFLYTASCTGDLTADTCGSALDTKLAIYNANVPCVPLATDLTDCNDDFCGLQSQLTVTVATGNTYLVRVGGFSGTVGGTGTLNLSCVVPSVCPNAVCEFDEDSCNCPADCGAPPVDETGLCEDGLDNDCDLLIDCLDTVDCNSTLLPAETACGDGLDNDCDTLIDCLDPDCAADPLCLPPTNDDCATATPVTTIPHSEVASSTFAASGLPVAAVTGCNSTSAAATCADVWWSYAPPSNCTMVLDVDPFDFDGVISVFEAVDCAGVSDLSRIVCDDDPEPYHFEIPVITGNTYFIQVGDWGSTCFPTDGGIIHFDLDCVTAICGNGAVEPGEECDDGNVIPNDGCSATCTLEGACCATDGTCLENQDQTACEATPGSSYAGDSVTCLVAACPVCGDGTVTAPEQCEPPSTATCDAFCQFIPPANDDCTAAIPLGAPASGGMVSAIGDNNGATNDATALCGTSDGGTGVWYTVMGTGNSFTATTCNPGTDYDTKLTVFCAGCGNQNCVDGNDDQSGPTDPACVVPQTGSTFNRASTVSWCTEAGKEYLIMVHGFSGATGNFELTVTDDATPCSTPPGCGTCGDGTCDSNEDSCSCAADCGPPPATETDCGDGIDNDCNGLTDCADITQCNSTLLPPETACGDGADNDCDAAIDCADTDCAADALCLPPANDDCINATAVGEGTFPFANNNATLDAAAPPVCDANMQDDIWYLYTASCTGTATISSGCTDPSTPDTVLEVYSTGICPPPAGNTNCSDDDCGLTTIFASTTTQAVVSGNDYLIRLSGWNGGTVSGTLEISCFQPAVCGDTVCEAGQEDQCNCPADCGAAPTNEGAGTCNDGVDNDCDGGIDCFDNDCLGIDGCPTTAIPTMSEWGLIVMVMLLLAAGTVVFTRRRRATA